MGGGSREWNVLKVLSKSWWNQISLQIWTSFLPFLGALLLCPVFLCSFVASSIDLFAALEVAIIFTRALPLYFPFGNPESYVNVYRVLIASSRQKLWTVCWQSSGRFWSLSQRWACPMPIAPFTTGRYTYHHHWHRCDGEARQPSGR